MSNHRKLHSVLPDPVETQKDLNQTEIGKIPEEWEVVRLGDKDVCEVVSGGTPSKNNVKYWNGNIPFVTPTDVTKLHNNFIDSTESYITEEGLKNSSARLLPLGTVLLTSRATIGFCAINKVLVTTNQGFANLICKDKTYNLYLLYFMQFIKNKLESLASGSTFKEVSKRSLRKLKLPLPPLPEQQKIASILSTVDDAVQKTDEVIKKTQELKKGLMQQLLTKGIGHTRFKQTEIGEIPKGWEVMKIGGITKEHKQGFYTSQKYDNTGTRLVRITDLLNPDISYSTMPTIKIDNKIFQQFKIDVGDFLIARSGAIGRYGIVMETVPCVFGSYIIRFRFDDSQVDNFYFGKLFESFLVSNQLFKITQGATNKNINAQNIKKIKIPLPPLPEQQKIAEILSGVDEKIEVERKRKEKLEKLKKGLMQDLLTGKVRVKVS